MIQIRDATTLALTKLRTRKVRLIITVVISGLLFSLLVAASMVVRGAMHSLQDFNKEGLGSRYIVSASPDVGYGFLSDTKVVDRALEIQKGVVARKKAEAKRLGIEYDSAADPSPVLEYSNPDGSKYRILDTVQPAATQAIKEHIATSGAQVNQKTFADIGASYKPKALFASRYLPYDQSGSSLQVLKDGKEVFRQEQKDQFMGGPPRGTDSFISSWNLMGAGLMEPFILPGQNLKTGSDGSIPMIVPRSAAEELLKLKSLPDSASSEETLARTKEIRDKVPSISFTACYRNAASANLVHSAVQTAEEIEKNKGKKDYQKPSLIYGIPTDPCGSVAVTRDVRTAEEKTLAAKQQEFDKLFGAEDPYQATLKFRIVGVVPDISNEQAFGVSQIINGLVVSTLGSGWYAPYEQLAEQPLVERIFNPANSYTPAETYYAEFASADQARQFIEKESCQIDYNKIPPGKDPTGICLAQNHPFSIGPYGSNSLGLDGAKKGFNKIFLYAALIISGIAAFIMMGIVGRMVADSRRETAVFRAIGAKRFDIVQIYLTYTVFLSLLVSAFALVVGAAGALILHLLWSPEVSVAALTAFNVQDLSKTFALYHFYLPDLLMIVGLTLAVGLLSSVLPLLRNIRRNPIRDMRDEG